MSKNPSIQEHMERLKREKEEAQRNTDKKDIVRELSHKEEAGTDFSKIAEEFTRAMQDQKTGSVNDEHVKDTVYIHKPLYDAFSALCVNRGDKKKYMNEAIKDFILKKYREIQQ